MPTRLDRSADISRGLDNQVDDYAAMTTTFCILAIPAHNEAASIAGCLTSVREARMPAAYEWREWRILDDGSTDGTSDRVRKWANDNPGTPLRLITGNSRQGKIATVQKCRESLATEGRPTDIAVFLDADVTVEEQTMTQLLSAFNDADLAAATGLSLPNRRRLGCLSSAFQLEMAASFARELGPNATRIEGRLYAYRLGALADFQYTPGLIVEDTQLTAFLVERRLRVRSVFAAVVRVTPAASYMDFYKQTYRAFQAAELAGPRYPTTIKEMTPLAIRVLFRTVRSDPVGAISYCVARVVAAIYHRIHPMTFTDQFVPSASTKVGLGGSGSAEPRSLDS